MWVSMDYLYDQGKNETLYHKSTCTLKGQNVNAIYPDKQSILEG